MYVQLLCCGPHVHAASFDVNSEIIDAYSVCMAGWIQDAIRSSTALDDQDLDIVNAKDIKLQRHLGNGAFGTVREGTLHYTTVAVKILKEGEVMGALGSLAQAGEADRQDIRRGLVRVRTLPSCIQYRRNGCCRGAASATCLKRMCCTCKCQVFYSTHVHLAAPHLMHIT